ncbi:MAG: hypothetical protein K2P81_15245 [Bacteriovoracaceae bacterium]|nr:hypothetical protein [Bacteriovoracaceae bacterium]
MLSLLLAFFVNFSLAQSQNECGFIDLRNESLGANRDQGEISWCYAFSSADLLGYRFQTNEKFSAADVALGHNQGVIPSIIKRIQDLFIKRKDHETWSMPYQTGFSKIALQRALNTGSCPESVFPSENWIKHDAVKGTIKVTLKEAMLDVAKLKDLTTAGLQLADLPFWYELPNITPEIFYETVKSYHRLHIFPRLRSLACEGNRTPYPENPEVTMKFRSARIFKTIDEQLQKNNPVLLDYGSDILRDHTIRRIKLSSLHTSLILGRRWNQGSCEYLIRDSHGTDCEGYDPVYQCESGNLWIPGENLHRNMTSIVYIEP